MSTNLTLPEAAIVDAAIPATKADASVAQTTKLPYQANHQVELLHLQAEIEALLHQLTTLKQQRTLTEDEQPDAIEAPILATR